MVPKLDKFVMLNEMIGITMLIIQLEITNLFALLNGFNLRNDLMFLFNP